MVLRLKKKQLFITIFILYSLINFIRHNLYGIAIIFQKLYLFFNIFLPLFKI